MKAEQVICRSDSGNGVSENTSMEWTLDMLFICNEKTANGESKKAVTSDKGV